jgi:protein gp37
MSEQEKGLHVLNSKVESKFNPANESIEWAKWSWNPITGCKYGCLYCYAAAMAKRRIHDTYPFGFEPTYRPNRLYDPMRTFVPSGKWSLPGYRNVFLCSMADLFGPWVPQELIDKILTVCEQNQQWRFLVLTKNPKRLPSITFPTNLWVGTTVDCQARVAPAIKALSKVKATVRFLSCEPLRERLTFPSLDCLDWIIMGAQTGSKPVQPDREWVEHLTAQVRAAGKKLYIKPNLLLPEGTSRPREYPV